MAEHLAILFAKTIKILACEVADPYQIREGLSESVTQALPALVTRAREAVGTWLSQMRCHACAERRDREGDTEGPPAPGTP